MSYSYEHQILLLWDAGMSVRQIAAMTYYSRSTVETVVRRMNGDHVVKHKAAMRRGSEALRDAVLGYLAARDRQSSHAA